MRSFLLAFVLSFIPQTTQAEDIQPTENTKGCYVAACSSGGNCVLDPFIRVANNENNSEDDEPQVWGYNPRDIHKDRNGTPFYITILERKFLKAGWVKHVEHTSCVCHCPQW